MIVNYDRVMRDLKNLPFLQEFKYRKSSPRRFYIKDKERILYVEFTCNNYGGILFLEPSYGVRYNILHKWFEKFCKKNLSSQRSTYSYAFTGHMIDDSQKGFYYFDCDGNNYDDEFRKLSRDMHVDIQYLLTHYSTLDKCYETEILPCLKKEMELPDAGVDWIFKDMALCKLISPKDFASFKGLVMSRLEWLRSRDEPNVMLYGNEIEDIIHYLETTDITKIP